MISYDKEKLFEIAKHRTKYNDKGQAVITKEDSWRFEDEWDEFYEELSDTDESE